MVRGDARDAYDRGAACASAPPPNGAWGSTLVQIVEFTICVCRNSYGLTKTEICINTFISSLLDR